MLQSIDKAKYYKSVYKDYEITFIGHSKGGAESIANAVATGKNAMVFNPATAYLEEHGVKNKNYKGDIEIYVVEGDMLNWGKVNNKDIATKVVMLKQQYGDGPLNTSLRDGYKNHLMETVIEAIEEQENKTNVKIKNPAIENLKKFQERESSIR